MNGSGARVRACCFVVLALGGVARAGPPRPADARPKVAVAALQSSGASASLAAAVGGAVTSELDRLGAFKVITAESIRALLDLERQQQLLGCSSGACLTEIAGAIGADYLVFGQVSRVGGGGKAESYGFDLAIASVRTGLHEGTATGSAGSESELVQLLPRAISRLTAKVLAARTGRLLVLVSEPGAVVKVDDQARGTTPLPVPLVLPSGPKTLTVEKQGFIAWQTDVTVVPGRLQEERVSLVPSPDHIRAYESHARKMRIGAWATTGAALAGVAAAVALQVQADRAYGDAGTPGTFLYYRQKLLEGATPPPGVDYRAEFQRLRNRVSTEQNLSYVAIGVAAASATAATWLWVAGDDPDRYARYRGVTALGPGPLPGGALLALAGAF